MPNKPQKPRKPKRLLASLNFPVKPLFEWFYQNQRKLPWRTRRTPYRVWISEIMLQQTQAQTVREYYDRWMKSLPSISDLAKADEDTLIYLWQGLGYYNRVKNLGRAARIVMKDWNGKLPQSSTELISLPGIGRYTAGAICSFAYNQSEPVVDGNIKRLFTRYFHLTPSQQTEPYYWKLAEELLNHFETVRSSTSANRSKEDWDYRSWNESLIELGALICKPQPQCQSCPIIEGCGSFLHQDQARLPLKKKIKISKQYSSLFIIRKKNRYLLFQRNNTKLLKGLIGTWEFPILEHHPKNTELSILVGELFDKYQIKLSSPEQIEKITRIKHHYTRYQNLVDVYLIKETKTGKDCNFFLLEELQAIGLSSINQSVRKLLIEAKTKK